MCWGRNMRQGLKMRMIGRKPWKRICTASCWGALKKAKVLLARALKKAREKGKAKPEARAKPRHWQMRTLETALKKVKKTRDLPSSTHDKFEEALKKVQKSPYLSKQSCKEKQEVFSGLGKKLALTKKILEKGGKNKLEVVKQHLLEACACMKEAKEEAKELVQLSMEALSKAGSSRAK